MQDYPLSGLPHSPLHPSGDCVENLERETLKMGKNINNINKPLHRWVPLTNVGFKCPFKCNPRCNPVKCPSPPPPPPVWVESRLGPYLPFTKLTLFPSWVSIFNTTWSMHSERPWPFTRHISWSVNYCTTNLLVSHQTVAGSWLLSSPNIFCTDETSWKEAATAKLPIKLELRPWTRLRFVSY